MSIISCEHVTKKFGDFTALKDVSLDIEPGKVFGFLGPNGAGKTTLIRIINRITLPTEGDVLFNGRPMQLSDVERIGYLPEERGLYKKFKIGEQAVYLAQLKGLSKAQAVHDLKMWFKKFDIQPWWNKKVEELSKGMAQKVQFIITVLHNPKLLILDEPFSGFDPINVNLIKDEILRMKAEGCTIILSTHNMESVEEMCDDIALFNKSKLILSGGLGDTRKAYGNNRVEVVYAADAGIADGETDPQAFIKNREGLFSVVSTTRDKDTWRSVLDVVKGVPSRNVLGELVNDVDIVSYQALMPKMRDIFIKLVNESGGATSQSLDDYRKNIKKEE